MTIYNILSERIGKIKGLQLKKNIPLKDYTTFAVGGPADFFLKPEKISHLTQALPIIQELKIPYFILGKGSNLIVGDKGFRGIIIYTGQLREYTIKENRITAMSGLLLHELAEITCQTELSGLEFASGIPGSLGGALYMNAGAYGGEMKDLVKKAKIVTMSGEVKELTASQLELDYRHSILQEEDYLAYSVTLALTSGLREEIRKKINKLHDKRWSKQPMEWPSAGSIFKRPPGHYTGPLIEKAGMKGASFGGAKVSEKHAGFIINKNNATAEDIVQLIELVKKEVYKISGVELEVEPRFVGEF